MIKESMPSATQLLIKLIDKDCTSTERLNSAITRGADVNMINKVRMTSTDRERDIGEYPLLARAILRQNYIATMLLIESGADANSRIVVGYDDDESISMVTFADRLNITYGTHNTNNILSIVSDAVRNQRDNENSK